MGDTKSGWANRWYPHVGDRGQMSSFRDAGHLLFDITGSLCAISIAESGAYFTIAEVPLSRWRSGGLHDVRVFLFRHHLRIPHNSIHRLIPMLLACGNTSGTLTPQMVSATFMQLINCIGTESDPSFLASLYKCFTDSLKVMGGPQTLTPGFQNGILEATKRQLQTLADKRKNRSQRPASELEDDKEDMALLEEIEDFALEDMGKCLYYLDAQSPLLVAVTSVKDMGFNQADSDDEEDEE